jgi:biopolymer transport protein ExbD
MGQAGYILRFVDIVLILLFGMISVSRIEPSDIKPPESTETPDKPIVQKRVLFVGVETNGTIHVGENNEVLSSLSDLTGFLQERIDQYGRSGIKVRIRSSRRAPMRYLMQIAALCDELGLQKSIEVETK